MFKTTAADRRIDRLAARRLALVTGREALDLGLTRDQIRFRVTSGRWTRLARDVFKITGAPATWQQSALAACLAGPRDTVASHMTAAALWGLCGPTALPHVTVPRSASGRMRIARVHHATLGAEDITRIGPIPVTRIARTLLDVAATASAEVVASFLDDACTRGLATPQAVNATITRATRAPGRAGIPLVRDALSVWTDPIRPGSQAEARLVRRLGEWGFPTPERQLEVRRSSGVLVGRVDLAWPEPMVGLEYDGEATHGPRRIEADESRHDRIVALGWTLLHADRLDLRPGDTRLASTLRSLLRKREVA